MANKHQVPTVTVQLPEAYQTIMAPPPRKTVSEWCDENRWLSDKFGVARCRWSTDLTPYLREPMDAFADPTVGTICLIKASRVGGTEFLYNVLAWAPKNAPMPALYVLDTENAVQDEFAGRVRSIFMESPTLQELQAGDDWAKVDPPMITLQTMRIYGAWASSPSTLIRRTIGIVLFDELDNCEKAAGRLGNNLRLVQDRLTNFGYRAKLCAATTPTTSSASGWRMYLESDQRRYLVPCPHCGHYQALVFSGITIPEGMRNPDEIEARNLATYRCAGCRREIEQRMQKWMVARGVWVPACQKISEKLPVDDATIVEAAATGKWKPAVTGPRPLTRHRGYWINSCYSPWRTWSEIMAKFLRVKDDPEEKRVFFNSWMAEPYEETIETTSIDVLEKRIPEGMPEDVVPSAAKILLCGADVQPAFIYYLVRAWGVGEESWLIRHGTCDTFDELYKIAFHTGFPLAGDARQRMICRSLAIDSGHRTDEVYTFGKKPGVTVMKGRDHGDFRTKPSKIEYMPRGGLSPESIVLYHVNTFLYKTKLQRLSATERWHFHRATTAEYLKHFTAEVLAWIRGRRGSRARRHQAWIERSPGAPNHWLDCEVYAAALADMLNVPLLRDDESPQNVIELPVGPAAADVAAAILQPQSSPASSSRKRRYGWQSRDE